MLKIYFEGSPPADTPFNYIGFISIIISFISILCTLYFIFLTKRMEFKKSKFDKFCVDPLNSSFKNLDNIFNDNHYLSTYRQEITDEFLDIQMLLIPLSQVYSNIETSKIVGIIEIFTDKVYKEKESKVNVLKSDYLSTKILIYNEFYNFAITQEMVLINLKKIKIKIKNIFSNKLSKVVLLSAL